MSSHDHDNGEKKLVDCIGWSKVIDVNVEHIWL